MEVSQERGFGSGVAVNGYAIDGWKMLKVGTMVTLLGGYTTSNFPGFANVLAMGVTTAQPSLGAGDSAVIMQYIEGYRVSRLAWGTASAQSITIGFWSAHHRTGTYTGVVTNGAVNRSYAFSYTQNVVDTPEYKTVTIPGDTTGAWAKDNAIGLIIIFAMACGTTQTAPSLNAWVTGNYVAGPGQVNAVAATTDAMYITGVVVLPGIEAPSAARSALIMRPYDQELVTCKRYWEQIDTKFQGYCLAGTANAILSFPFTVEKRNNPTMAYFASGGLFNASINAQSLSPRQYTLTLNIGVNGLFGTNDKANFDARL
jgi:hypothetical protein